ncbi:Apolipoprotein N-acyltransferase [Candidatus Rubidus massiliensis]|nr:MAG: apolipoprotein N-acyltransferase [Chlamydia sp. 32-24]CDZ80452.1 Apolipoprotein N-acyltransferase [Candidatus Rubidus massiliensis]
MKYSYQHVFLFIASCLIASLSLPSLSVWSSFFSTFVSYSIIFFLTIQCDLKKQKFWLGTAWFTFVNLSQLSWFLSHPFYYILILWIVLSLLLGMQFGFICSLINKKNIKSISSILGIASLWTLLEWSRLFFLSGFSFSPLGMSWSFSLYAIQFASLIGIYGLSFWLILTNLLILRAYIYRFSFVIPIFIAITPYLFGFIHYSYHKKQLDQHTETFDALLIQTGFPIEETLPAWNSGEMVLFVMEEWKRILLSLSDFNSNPLDLIALPEFTVPYGTYSFAFPYDQIYEMFSQYFSKEKLDSLPQLKAPFAYFHPSRGWYVNNAFIAQGIANIFQTNVVAGLEDAENVEGKGKVYYSSAQYFCPFKETIAQEHTYPTIDRYDKRVLVPMGEYIPFTFLSELAKSYGIGGSLTHGKNAKVFTHNKTPFSTSICYEETFGHLIREGSTLGSRLLVNLTSDVWFPTVSQNHFDHGKIRTVENGVPLIRCCNVGITCGVDALGQLINRLENDGTNQKTEALLVKIPTYHYQTLYAKTGDNILISFCGLFAIYFFIKRKKDLSN